MDMEVCDCKVMSSPHETQISKTHQCFSDVGKPAKVFKLCFYSNISNVIMPSTDLLHEPTMLCLFICVMDQQPHAWASLFYRNASQLLLSFQRKWNGRRLSNEDIHYGLKESSAHWASFTKCYRHSLWHKAGIIFIILTSGELLLHPRWGLRYCYLGIYFTTVGWGQTTEYMPKMPI